MSKISNQGAYPALLQPTLNDYLVITDFDNKLQTKTVTLNSVKNLFDVSSFDGPSVSRGQDFGFGVRCLF